MSTVETLEIDAECDAKGYGIAVANRGDAVVETLQGAAAIQKELKKYDRITHVNGEGPLDFDGTLAALKKCKESATACRLTVARGEKLRPLYGRAQWGCMKSVGLLVVLCGIGLATFDGALEQLAAIDAPAAGLPQDGQGVGAPEARGPRRTAVQVGGKKFSIAEDGSAEDPDGLRAAFRSDAAMMQSMRKEKPEWARVIVGNEDGSYDVRKFQRIMKDNYKSYETSKAVKLNDDGSAEDPAAYLAALRSNKDGRKWLRQIKEFDAGVHEAIDSGDTEALQGYLRYVHKRRTEPPPPPPVNPATPYDDMAQVDMSMRILTDEGEEKDLFSIRPKEVEEEKWMMPLHLRCPACEAAAYQGALAIQTALAKRHHDDLIGVTTVEALQELCANERKWSSDYGLVPTSNGVNQLEGPGVTMTASSLRDNTDVMLQQMHTSQWGSRLGAACSRHLLGVDAPEEDELASVVLELVAAGASEEALTGRFRSMLCEQPSQPCASA